MLLKIDKLVPAKTGFVFSVKQGDYIKIIDVEGRQVTDFTAVNRDNHHEHLSMGVTLDINSSFRLNQGSKLYSNLYHPMLEVVEDTVGAHDLIHPMCSTDMYASQYGITDDHPSCTTNIRKAYLQHGVKLKELPIPLNIFMNTIIRSNGDIEVKIPESKPGDFILLQAQTNLIIAVAACSVEESACNGFKCSPIRVQKMS